jgi:hypothetical protein
MPLRFRIDHEARLVVAAAFGTLTHDDVFGYQHEVWTRNDVHGYDEIVDMTGVTFIAVQSYENIRELARVAAESDDPFRKSKLAIVAPTTLAFEIGRMFQTYREWESKSTKQVEVFRTMDEALRFLGIHHPLEFPKAD